MSWFKVGTKSGDVKLLEEKKLKENFRGLEQNVWIFIGTKNIFNNNNV